MIYLGNPDIVAKRVIRTLTSPFRHCVGEGANISLGRCPETIKKGWRYPPRVMMIRHLMKVMGIDEDLVFKWFMHHKYVQYLVLERFIPGEMPQTVNISDAIVCAEDTKVDLVCESNRRDEIVIKTALGYCSKETGRLFDNLEDARRAWMHGWTTEIEKSGEIYADCIAQERLRIVREYRVHTFKSVVIENLSFARFAPEEVLGAGERHEVNAYVKMLLHRLPACLLEHAVCGWDIARTMEGRFYVVEVNFAGNHPIMCPGFQCSGYLGNEVWGAMNQAILLRDIEKGFGLRISLPAWNIEEADEILYNEIYMEIALWKELFEKLPRETNPYDEVFRGQLFVGEDVENLSGAPRKLARFASLLLKVSDTQHRDRQ